jgi:hypothetical protein
MMFCIIRSCHYLQSRVHNYKRLHRKETKETLCPLQCFAFVLGSFGKEGNHFDPQFG